MGTICHDGKSGLFASRLYRLGSLVHKDYQGGIIKLVSSSFEKLLKNEVQHVVCKVGAYQRRPMRGRDGT